MVYPIIQKNNSCIATLLFKLLLICFHLHLMHHNLYSVKFSFHFLQFKVRYFFTKISFSVYYSSTLEFSNNAISSWNFYDYLSMFILTAHIFWLLQPSLLTFSMLCSQCLFIFSHFSSQWSSCYLSTSYHSIVYSNKSHRPHLLDINPHMMYLISVHSTTWLDITALFFHL